MARRNSLKGKMNTDLLMDGINIIQEISTQRTQLSRDTQLAARIDQLGAMQAAFIASWNAQVPPPTVPVAAPDDVYEDPATNKPFGPIV